MKTIFSDDYIGKYDKLKHDIFHAKKQQVKAELRNKQPKPTVQKLKKSFPWRSLIKISSFATIAYLTYNYADQVLDQAIKRKYVTSIDFMSLRVLKADALVKAKTFFSNPQDLKKVGHFANFMYQSQLQKDVQYLNKIYPYHVLKSSIESNFKLWIFQFKNFERSQYVNQFGDVVEKKERSFLRIGSFPMFKSKTEKVVQEENVHKSYRTILYDGQNNDSKSEQSLESPSRNRISEEIESKCERINILNRFSAQYEELLTECKQNNKFGSAILEHMNYRENFYAYPKIVVPQN